MILYDKHAQLRLQLAQCAWDVQHFTSVESDTVLLLRERVFLWLYIMLCYYHAVRSLLVKYSFHETCRKTDAISNGFHQLYASNWSTKNIRHVTQNNIKVQS